MIAHVKSSLPGKVTENEPRLVTGGQSQTAVQTLMGQVRRPLKGQQSACSLTLSTRKQVE